MTLASTGPAGLHLRRSGEGIEEVGSKSAVVRLLSAGQGTEVIEVGLKPDGRLTLVPPAATSLAATETYYVLHGSLECRLPGGTAIMRPGDHIVASEITDPVILRAKDEARLLYVTSRPFFHEISGNIRELMNIAVEIELKDGYTADHCMRLQRLANATAEELQLDVHRQYLLNYGAYLHDVGKIKVPLEILTKPGKLNDKEWAAIKKHPSHGREMLAATFMRAAGPIVEQHHERLDGSGYPHGLAGDSILVEAYIVAVVDTYDAMTTDRPYRNALDPDVAFAELAKCAGTQYPKEVVKAFTAAVRRVELASN